MKDKPAFPRSARLDAPALDGMTLREYYAGQALSGILANSAASEAGASLPDIVEESVRAAVLLIAELEK